MSGKPAARLGDPTACPKTGHGTNLIAVGSPDVLFDGLPAARMGDASACGGAMASAVIPNVLIDGKPAVVVCSVGNHGNVVTAGSGTVIIGTSGGGLPVSPVSSLSIAATAAANFVNALVPAAQASEQAALDYSIRLMHGGNRVLTPLMIPDFTELPSGTTKNRETIDFLVQNHRQKADSLALEVFDRETLVYSETDTSRLLPAGEHLWQWDGYDLNGVLDTGVLKSEQLVVQLTARIGGEEQVTTLRLSNSAEEATWVDARVNRNGNTVELTVRPSFSNGGIKGRNEQLTARNFAELKALAKSGIERYWSRDGSRGAIGAAVQTDKGVFRVKVSARVNEKPSAKDFPLIASISDDFGRSTSFAMFKKIYHNQGWWAAANYTVDFADQEFEHTAAHELGHLILNEYGDGGMIPEYSWSHKSTSTVLTQKPLDNNPVPAGGEIDLMHYHSDGPRNMLDYWARTVASENDVKGLLWLARVKFNA